MSDSEQETLIIKEVELCEICGLPHEYCDWGDFPNECSAAKEPEQEGDEEGEEGEKDAESAPKKSSKKEKVKMASQIQVLRSKRGSRKFVTVVIGLEEFGVDLGEAATLFRKKFACGASTVKAAGGEESIDIQGDLTDEVIELISEKFNIDEDKITTAEKKRPKKAKTAGKAPKNRSSRGMRATITSGMQ
ncbi:Translation initiation factor SUI1 [Carpediemonas membranifera]|uniref:Translation initiation factor SUI1 n=1 Tax=Carpediemonas membranifera TaxID=201153 RepID=A0A8J6B0I9_9EUKA|nr:Translation initiation factor SUI1 [Carpediemonas membranifera]|eukprot:KAG9390329.1 Translation initiation factor SUI1 [Carpediemonas membranifera]